MKAINPATGNVIEEYDDDTPSQIDEKLDRAARAFDSWKGTPFDVRSDVLLHAAERLRADTEDYARIITDEMGKPITESRSEVEKCAWVCDYYADYAERFLEPKTIETDASTSYVRYDPLGPILAVMPWNFPFWQVFRFAAPSLMAGNVGLLKHAPNVPGCALAIEELFVEAGAPEDVFQTLLVDADQVSRIISDARVRGATLTGSVAAGSAVGKIAGREIKPSVLELGGSDPFIVLDDCDLAQAVDGAITGRFLNSGQSCIAAKRFIVEKGVHDEFVEKFRAEMKKLKVGDPVEDDTDIGPQAREDLLNNLEKQVQDTIAEGATCLLGGEPISGEGYFYPPTLLVDVDHTMTSFVQEVFGPVASVIKAEDLEHAITLANDSDFGLGASIWTERNDVETLIPHIDAGHVAVNGIVKSDPRLPFGGIKNSGYGRELADDGIREFVNRKTVWIR